MVPRHALPLEILHREVALGQRVALVGGFAKPARGGVVGVPHPLGR